MRQVFALSPSRNDEIRTLVLLASGYSLLNCMCNVVLAVIHKISMFQTYVKFLGKL